MEHVGLYVGLAVYTLAGAKVLVQRFTPPQLGPKPLSSSSLTKVLVQRFTHPQLRSSHLNHHLHPVRAETVYFQIFQVIENPAEQEKLEVFQVNFQSLEFANCCTLFLCYRYDDLVGTYLLTI